MSFQTFNLLFVQGGQTTVDRSFVVSGRSDPVSDVAQVVFFPFLLIPLEPFLFLALHEGHKSDSLFRRFVLSVCVI